MDKQQVNVEEISKLLDLATEKVPGLIRSLLQSFYAEEVASSMGKAVGSLYKQLIEAGLPQDVAAKMASDYMVSLREVSKVMGLDESHER
ncbi:hypothetical protein [Brevibacillus migulae]|uniref:hypothetical protein n=1 Tax=Brevibacillus migulae TaxID=1644114 RepID=UPI00106DE771|nr:hypothetical protein [Brevibacillus migulae]